MTIGSLFAGIGGFDLAAKWIGWSTAWFSEIEPYASAVLAKHWPGVPNHGDITQIKGVDVAPVDLLCGGFPCQDISLVGKGIGIEGARSGLWAHYARLIGELRPKWVVIENVSALRYRGLDRVLKDLAALGYDAEWHCIPAAAVGAPHRRDRIWIVVYPNTVSDRVSHDRRGEVAGAASAMQGKAQEWQRIRFDVGELRDAVSDSSCGGGSGQWTIEPDVGRVAYGVPARVDRLRCLGNAIVPQVAYHIFKAIQAAEDVVAISKVR